jgi:AcrR family transcriptional regulator
LVLAGSPRGQKKRTRIAIVDACREIIRSGGPVTMPEVARSALVSEATASRYYPDLVSLLNEAIVGLWPSPADARHRGLGLRPGRLTGPMVVPSM